MRTFLISRRHPLFAGLSALLVASCVLALPGSASAQDAASLYQRARAREDIARKAPAASAATLRSIATAYEAIPRRFPRSGYADNALFQAAGVLQLAFERGKVKRDRDQAMHLLRWLKTEYPTSSLIRDANARLAALSPAAAEGTRAAAAAPVAPKSPPPAVASTAAIAAGASTAADTDVSSPNLFGPVSEPAPAITSRAATIQEVTHSTLPRGDRITIQFNREVLYQNQRTTDPDRLVIDLTEATSASGVAADAATLRGELVRAIGIGSQAAGTTRVALELVGRPRYSIFPLYNPFRLVIDLESDSVSRAVESIRTPAPTASAASHVPASMPVAKRAASPAPPAVVPTVETVPQSEVLAEIESIPLKELPAAPPPAPAAITRQGSYSLARQLGLGVSRIVIDPGHGGHDPGAKANDVSEAELVLDVALRLEKLLLTHPGVEVVLTRRTNTFIPLEERTAIANRENADLFLSIHANSSRQTATRGVETFILNFATNPQAEAVAARENASSVKTMSLLPQLVQAIALNNKVDESRELASMVQSSLVKRLRPQAKDLKDLGVKQAPFVVLIGAGMPAILSEISFITNRTDAALLKQNAHRQRIAEALGEAVLRYQSSLKKSTPVATVDAAR